MTYVRFILAHPTLWDHSDVLGETRWREAARALFHDNAKRSYRL